MSRDNFEPINPLSPDDVESILTTLRGGPAVGEEGPLPTEELPDDAALEVCARCGFLRAPHSGERCFENDPFTNYRPPHRWAKTNATWGRFRGRTA